jgi:hypothetical protein
MRAIEAKLTGRIQLADIRSSKTPQSGKKQLLPRRAFRFAE